MIAANLALRLTLLAVVLLGGGWYFGDAYSYLYYAADVCAGNWGGEIGRPPLYLWYLCTLSPSVNRPGTGAQLFLPMLFQTLAVWSMGYWLWRKGDLGRKVAVFWLFDPVLLVYSTIAMTDAWFSTILLVFLLVLFSELRSAKRGYDSALGILGAALALMRPNGFIIMMASSVLYFVRRGLNLASLRRWAWAAALCLCLLMPRMYWNSTHEAGWTLSVQGDSWLASVAGVVASHGKNLDAHQAEDAWFAAKGVSPTRAEAMKTLLGQWDITAWLSLKGMARVLFGHVNTEWWHLITGRTPVGPSWFKPPESRADAPLTQGELLIWVAGIAVLMGWALYFYREVFRSLRAQWLNNTIVEQGWLLAMALLLAALPLVYGEARFRLAVWPFLFMILLRGKNEAPAKS